MYIMRGERKSALCNLFVFLKLKLLSVRHAYASVQLTQGCLPDTALANDAVVVIKPLTAHQSSSPFVFLCVSPSPFWSAGSELWMHIHLLTALLNSLPDCFVASKSHFITLGQQISQQRLSSFPGGRQRLE